MWGLAIRSTPPLLATVGELNAYSPAAVDQAGSPVAAAFSLVNPPARLDIDAQGRLTWTPTAAQLGPRRVTVRAAADGQVGFQSYEVRVLPVNIAPVVTPPADTGTTAGAAYRGRATATDDVDAFRFGLAAGAPAGLGIDPLTGVLGWATGTGDAGSYPVTVTATDARGAVGSAAFTLVVRPDAAAPSVAVIPIPAANAAGSPVPVAVPASDDVGVVGRTLKVNGAAVALDANGLATYTPAAPGVYALVGTARDAAGNVATATARLRVADPADTAPPVVTITAPRANAVVTYLTDLVGTIADASPFGYRVEVSRFDADEWRTIYTSDSAPTSATLAVFDPTLLDNDQHVVRVVATDLNGREGSAEVPLELDGRAKPGQFRQEFTDLQVPLAGVPITITRVYDLLKADQAGDFGFGWSLGAGYDPRPRETVPANPAESILGMFAAVAFEQGTRVYVTTPDGRRVGFTFEPKPYQGVLGALGAATGGLYTPYFKPDGGVFETLAGEYDGGNGFPLPLLKFADRYYLAGISVAYNPVGYRLTTKDGLSYHFGQAGGVQDITNRDGVKLTFTRDGITSSRGTAITFQRDDQGRIASITDPNGGTLRNRYDAGGNLVGAKTQVGLEERYAYEAADRPHFLSTVYSVGGYPSTRLEYDADGRLIGETNGAGDRITSGYDLAGFRETVTDGLGRVTTLTYDSRGNVTDKVDPLGRE